MWFLEGLARLLLIIAGIVTGFMILTVVGGLFNTWRIGGF